MVGDIEETGDQGQLKSDRSEDEIVEGSVNKDVDLMVDDDTINDGSTAEIKVDALIAKIESGDADDAAHQREIRQKLEALQKNRDDDHGSTYNFNIDEDL